MRKLFVFLLLIIIASCKKETSIKRNSNKETDKSKKIALQTDTIGISGHDTKSNYFIASLLNKTFDKDSIETVQYRLDFYLNNIKTASKDITINDVVKDAEWIANYGFSPEDDSSVSPFIQLDYGLQTDTSLQHNYLFYVANQKAQIVCEWESSVDSGWGAWTEFLNTNPKNEKATFYSRAVSFDPKNETDDTIGIVSYSDSTKIYFENGEWKNQLLTPKSKVYRKKEISPDSFYAHK